MTKLTIGSLFAGIGGLELGLERAGMGPVEWQVELDPFCRKVLAKHWPDARRFEDVRKVGSGELGPVDVICGGFPCVDISSCRTRNSRRGLAGAGSGLWSEMRRIVDELRPPWVIVENSPEWRRWTGSVSADLECIGYTVETFRVAAENLGAPHSRPRVFAVAHANRQGQPVGPLDGEVALVQETSESRGDWRSTPPGGYRVANGIPHRVDRNRALGNAVVPQVAEVIGRAVLEAADHA
jgi:DNA (cytosine-5)-methyltransferase 1